jgi:hypothetical protein
MRLRALIARVARLFRWLSKPRGATNRELEHIGRHSATTLPPNLHGGGFQG